MALYVSQHRLLESGSQLLWQSSLIAVASLVFIWQNPEPLAISIPEVSIPLAVALGLGIYTLRLRQRGLLSEKAQLMVKYSWIGAILASIIGGFWLALHFYSGLPIDVLPDKILTIASIGIAAGSLCGHSKYDMASETQAADRKTVLLQTSWTNRSDEAPVVAAVLEGVAEVEAIDPLELEPLSEYIDPDNLSGLRSQDNSKWQLTFHAYGYEIGVGSHGTVTIYQSALSDDPFDSI